ncbi:unnamed protein product [Citrullus colocynthis]|uniref:Uncharacterized protein n=1 Tax=Citrullus colocynthis TaxID=252529 RepID=A0ABP0Y709_9ROSI
MGFAIVNPGFAIDITTRQEARSVGRFVAIVHWFIPRGKSLPIRRSFTKFVRHCSSDRGSCTMWKPLAATHGAAVGVIVDRVGACWLNVSETQRGRGQRA